MSKKWKGKKVWFFNKKWECIACGAKNKASVKFCTQCGTKKMIYLIKYDVFISYSRNTASEAASVIQLELEKFNKNVFLDVTELKVGRFDEKLLGVIEKVESFILILSENCLESDWLKREILHALDNNIKIIPVVLNGFKWPSPKIYTQLPEKFQVLPMFQSIEYNHTSRGSTIQKIIAAMAAPHTINEQPDSHASISNNPVSKSDLQISKPLQEQHTQNKINNKTTIIIPKPDKQSNKQKTIKYIKNSDLAAYPVAFSIIKSINIIEKEYISIDLLAPAYNRFMDSNAQTIFSNHLQNKCEIKDFTWLVKTSLDGQIDFRGQKEKDFRIKCLLLAIEYGKLNRKQSDHIMIQYKFHEADYLIQGVVLEHLVQSPQIKFFTTQFLDWALLTTYGKIKSELLTLLESMADPSFIDPLIRIVRQHNSKFPANKYSGQVYEISNRCHALRIISKFNDERVYEIALEGLLSDHYNIMEEAVLIVLKFPDYYENTFPVLTQVTFGDDKTHLALGSIFKAMLSIDQNQSLQFFIENADFFIQGKTSFWFFMEAITDVNINKLTFEEKLSLKEIMGQVITKTISDTSYKMKSMKKSKFNIPRLNQLKSKHALLQKVCGNMLGIKTEKKNNSPKILNEPLNSKEKETSTSVNKDISIKKIDQLEVSEGSKKKIEKNENLHCNGIQNNEPIKFKDHDKVTENQRTKIEQKEDDYHSITEDIFNMIHLEIEQDKDKNKPFPYNKLIKNNASRVFDEHLKNHFNNKSFVHSLENSLNSNFDESLRVKNLLLALAYCKSNRDTCDPILLRYKYYDSPYIAQERLLDHLINSKFNIETSDQNIETQAVNFFMDWLLKTPFNGMSIKAPLYKIINSFNDPSIIKPLLIIAAQDDGWQGQALEVLIKYKDERIYKVAKALCCSEAKWTVSPAIRILSNYPEYHEQSFSILSAMILTKNTGGEQLIFGNAFDSLLSIDRIRTLKLFNENIDFFVIKKSIWITFEFIKSITKVDIQKITPEEHPLLVHIINRILDDGIERMKKTLKDQEFKKKLQSMQILLDISC